MLSLGVVGSSLIKMLCSHVYFCCVHESLVLLVLFYACIVFHFRQYWCFLTGLVLARAELPFLLSGMACLEIIYVVLLSASYSGVPLREWVLRGSEGDSQDGDRAKLGVLFVWMGFGLQGFPYANSFWVFVLVVRRYYGARD